MADAAPPAPPPVTGPAGATDTGVPLSTAGFPYPIDHWDCHIYFLQTNPKQTEFARQLRETISGLFPQLKMWPFHDYPHGPHTVGMFEVDVRTPADFSVFIPWLTLNRGPLSILVHPHRRGPEAEAEPRAAREVKDHYQHSFWMGDKHHLDFEKLFGDQVPKI
ncbi:DOPA-like domain-containing protein [Hyaloraphidium curvatum]|nr:DOPA-like domain-containing protein [Hyaloraphidium curvatum]